MATLTITTTAAQNTRIVKAFGGILGLRDGNDLPRNATAAEVKSAVIDYVKETVLRHERNEAVQAASDAISPITPT